MLTGIKSAIGYNGFFLFCFCLQTTDWPHLSVVFHIMYSSAGSGQEDSIKLCIFLDTEHDDVVILCPIVGKCYSEVIDNLFLKHKTE